MAALLAAGALAAEATALESTVLPDTGDKFNPGRRSRLVVTLQSQAVAKWRWWRVAYGESFAWMDQQLHSVEAVAQTAHPRMDVGSQGGMRPTDRIPSCRMESYPDGVADWWGVAYGESFAWDQPVAFSRDSCFNRSPENGCWSPGRRAIELAFR